MWNVNYSSKERFGQYVTWGTYGHQYEACYVASQLAQTGTTATVEGPGGVHTTYFPRPAK